MVMGL